jgi:hypothetical protein
VQLFPDADDVEMGEQPMEEQPERNEREETMTDDSAPDLHREGSTAGDEDEALEDYLDLREGDLKLNIVSSFYYRPPIHE